MSSPLDLLNRPNTDSDYETISNSENMSYADMAAKGPKQSDDEKVPHALPEIVHDDSAVASVDSLQESGVHVADPTGAHEPIPHPSYAEQQRQHELAQQAEADAKKAADQVTKEAKDFMDSAEADAQRLAGDANKGAQNVKKDAKNVADKAGNDAKNLADQAGKDAKNIANQASKDAKNLANKAEKKFEQAKSEAADGYEKAKKEAKPYVEKAERKGKEAEDWAEKNKGNPVVVGNAVALAALGGVLSIGAYRMHKANTLTWNVVGAWAGAVGLFAIGDYYVSQYFFKRYPPKN